jgi:hypothetical protein
VNTELLQQVLSGEAPPLFSISVEQLHRMQREGILTPAQPVELIDGILVRKDRSFRGEGPMVHNPGHAGAVSHVHRVLDRRVEPHGCHARSQLPVTLDEGNEPEPDVKVVDGDAATYWVRHPTPADVRLAVEVSHSSLEYDRTVKLLLFATAGIPRYWIINLVDHQIEAFWSPVPDQGIYAEHAAYTSGDVLKFDLPSGEVQVAFNELLPARFRGA